MRMHFFLKLKTVNLKYDFWGLYCAVVACHPTRLQDVQEGSFVFYYSIKHTL